nr:DUF5615 family PIN-like protein [Chamaesiphon sp. OTE_20_metabat_361]
MLKLLADENFDNTILRGLLRRQPDIDIIRVQDTEFYGANDPTVLAWAAQENRILLIDQKLSELVVDNDSEISRLD